MILALETSDLRILNKIEFADELIETSSGLISQSKTNWRKLNLEREYRTIRKALINAGLMTSNLDSLYSDWQRWREESKMRASERLPWHWTSINGGRDSCDGLGL